MKIIGIRPSSFKGERGEDVTGMNIYMTYPLEKGEGLGCERVFVTDVKAARWSYKPKVSLYLEVKRSCLIFSRVVQACFPTPLMLLVIWTFLSSFPAFSLLSAVAAYFSFSFAELAGSRKRETAPKRDAVRSLMPIALAFPFLSSSFHTPDLL